MFSPENDAGGDPRSTRTKTALARQKKRNQQTGKSNSRYQRTAITSRLHSPLA